MAVAVAVLVALLEAKVFLQLVVLVALMVAVVDMVLAVVVAAQTMELAAMAQ
jgi:hypothetical protein